MRAIIRSGLILAFAGTAGAAEVTVQNDSLTAGTGVLILGFASGEKAASWLTSPCDGNIVAAQIFWRSLNGGAAQAIEDSLEIYRAGAFPEPGMLAQSIGGPVLTDGVMNEFRYLDENNTVPLIVPVTQGETFVLAMTFAEPTGTTEGPSLVRDTDGLQPSRNALYGDIGIGQGVQWYDNATLGINGDWVIRAVVNCTTVSTNADVGVTMSATPTAYTAGTAEQYTIIVANAGPATSPNTTLVDTFPSALQGPTWTCTPSGGATCPAGSSGNIIGSTSMPSGSHITFTVNGTIAPGTTGTLTNSMTAVVNAPATDPGGTNNTASLDLDPAASDVIFTNGFDPSAGMPPVVQARATGFAMPHR
jgi:uncharacterized repeat protein (TIGR01451 family)